MGRQNHRSPRPVHEEVRETDEVVRAQAAEILTTWSSWTGAGSRGSIRVLGLGTVTVELER